MSITVYQVNRRLFYVFLPTLLAFGESEFGAVHRHATWANTHQLPAVDTAKMYYRHVRKESFKHTRRVLWVKTV
jgi:hypothetical protein